MTNNTLAVAILLLANGAKVDTKATDGRTPLHVAAWSGHPTVAKFLLANGADPNAKAKDGTTPLDTMPELAEIVKKLETEQAGKKQPTQPKVANP